MTTQSTSTNVITTSFNISYPDSKSSACPEFNITATRTPGKKDIFKIMAVVNGQLVEPKGKLAPKLFMSDDLRRCAIADLDKKQKEAEAQVITVKPAKVKMKSIIVEALGADIDLIDPSVKKELTGKAVKAGKSAAASEVDSFVKEFEQMEADMNNSDPEAKMTHETERMLEVKNDMANLEEALKGVKPSTAKAKTKKAATEKADKAETATTDSAKADVHTPDMFERFNAAVAAGKVITKEGNIKAVSAEFKDSRNGGLYEVKLENKKVWKTNFRRINQYYTIQD